MLNRFAPLLLALFAAIPAMAGTVEKTPVESVAYDPLEHWEFSFESGALWRVGHNGTPLDYVILPQMLTLKSPASINLGEIAGGDLVIRNRFSLLLEPIVEGPEDYYFGFSASGSLEWWTKSRDFSLFFAAGGGLGWMNSKGYEVEGAQGQDLNFNWFLYSGARWMCCERMSLSLGVLYQHVSNTGLDEVNPGIDALGPVLGLTWHL